MRQAALLLSRLLAIVSATAFLMGIALLGHSILTPQTHLPRLPEEGPSTAVRFGAGTVGAAVVLGLLGYVLARFAAAGESKRE